MKIKKITHLKGGPPLSFYDILEARPYHNFLVKTNTSTIISHNCSFEDEIN